MLNKRHNPVAAFFILLTLVGVSKPAKALLGGQNDGVMASISEVLPQETRVKIASSDNAIIAKQTDRESFTSRSSQVKVSNTKDSKSAEKSRSQNHTDIAEIARQIKLEKSLKFTELSYPQNNNAIANKINSIPALDTYTNSYTRNSNVSLNFVINADPDKSRSSTNIDKNLNANLDLEDSGEINADWKDSGEIDSNLEDSGEINFEVEGTGDVEPRVNLENSGELNPNLEDSGSVDPNLEDSGQTISFKVDSSKLISQADGNTVAPNRVEGEETATRRKGQWWWWLPLIIGIPIVAAVVISSFGRKRSDREPAIDNVQNINTASRDINVAGTPSRENLSALGANVGNVDGLDTTIATSATSISSATLAEDNIDLDIDRSNLEDVNSVAEIPSNSVSEFTGYETKLHGDRSLELQDNDIDLESIDNIPPIDPIDNVAASELVIDLNIEEARADSALEVDSDATTDIESDTNTLEPLNNPAIDTSARSRENTPNNNIVDADAAIENVEAKEFEGDFILQEETQGFTPYQQADFSDVDLAQTSHSNDLDIEDRTVSELNSEESDLALGRVDSEIDIVSKQARDTAELTTDRETSEAIGFDGNLDLNTGDRTASSFEVASSAADSELFDELDSQARLDPEFVEEQNNERVDGLDLGDGTVGELDLEEPVPAWDKVNSQTDIEPTTDRETTEVIGFDSDLHLEHTKINLDLEPADSAIESQGLGDSDLVSQQAASGNLVDDFEVVNITIDEISFDDSDDNINSSLEEISFDDSGLEQISLDDDSTQTTEASLDEISFNELEEISFDDSELEQISLDDDSTQTVDASLDEVSLDNSQSDTTNEVDNSNPDRVSYKKLDKTRANLTLDLLSNSTAGITNLSDDEFEDMNNITEWLDSLETPQQNTDNILEWLDSLKTENADPLPDGDREIKSEETNDVSFQFIEDLLENDDPNRENK